MLDKLIPTKTANRLYKRDKLGLSTPSGDEVDLDCHGQLGD